MKTHTKYCFLTSLIACIIGVTSAHSKELLSLTPDELGAVSQKFMGDPGSLKVLHRTKVNLKHSGKSFTYLKVINPKTQQSLRVAVDSNADLVDADKLLANEAALKFEKYGVMHENLYNRISKDTNAKFKVLIKLNIPENIINKEKLPDGFEIEVASTIASKNEMALKRKSTAALRSAFGTLKSDWPNITSQSGPFIRTELPAAALLGLSKNKNISFIGLDDEKEVYDYPTIAESLPSTQTDRVHNWYSNKGAGVNIAILESGTTSVSQSCFNISDVQLPGSAANSHMTKSAAIIGNRYNGGACNGSWQGYAPSSNVFIANASSYIDRYNWAKTKNANVITMSWHSTSEETVGTLSSRDIYFDHVSIRYPWPTVFTSAGNQAPTAYASGKGYNFFGVGNINNDGDGNRCNDTIASSSSYKDPTSPYGHREVPEIASPGSRHNLIGSSFGGTSAATPVTAAIAALLMSNNTSLKSWPEAVRAILLATANFQNADGSNWSRTGEGKDGTGMTNAYFGHLTSSNRESSTVARYRAHDYGYIDASSFSSSWFYKSWKAKTSTTNSKIRVALTWNSKTTSSSSVLDADLDLRIYNSAGNLVAWSSTFDNNHEFVEFTPPAAGEYTIKIREYGIPSDLSTHFGIAWTTHYDLCT